VIPHRGFVAEDWQAQAEVRRLHARENEIGRRAMKDYHINIFYSEEDGGYIADIPDLAACSAFGQTPDEALKEVQRARKAWLEAARHEGKPIPKARYRPAVYQLAS
jgi:predicted RNase H-like HicB family nuclease